ncbi:CidB/LrgB family autolysis modulator [Oxalobacter vibrioformis]|uniref:CidB/LrgB family autolysis modulator n=1 Tax=Oxalobacter vibrioformis TaxID=933080 RepID=A0A9E9LUS0_9BURK|nr:CidB/LrgB family autolysis modulator [Oxalobacter vibrioformis]WAW09092.1 CidB/LrgB family autolysis modulator [Oxalobacter vibrioformis]
MSHFLHSEVLFITLTIAVFWGAQLLQRRLGWVLLNPILLAIAIIILILKAGNISYDTYENGSRYIAFLLKPAIVALGVPLYQQLEQIKKQAVPIFASQLVACIVGVFSAVFIAYVLGASPEVCVSLSPKSATTPIAMEVSRVLGGIPALTAVIVILTGILGAIVGLPFLKLIRVRSRIAQGLALGAAAHAVGTAHAMEKNARQGAYSSLGLILNGTLTGLLTPWLLQLLSY